MDGARGLRVLGGYRCVYLAAVALCAGLLAPITGVAPEVSAAETDATITVDTGDEGRRFDGVGSLSAGASSRLLYDYPEPERSQILDYMFKPGYGAALDILKVEIGAGTNSTAGSEPTHMRAPGEVDCTRGYEWWLMKEAVRRNPDIKLAGLEWGAPGWFDGGFWSRDNIDYILAWLGCARRHGLDIDYVGGWNERGYVKSWYVDLARALKRNRFDAEVVAADSFSWDIAADMETHPRFRRAVDIVGMHFVCGHRTEYKNCSSTETARDLDKPLWMSENSSMSHDAGAAPLARALNRMYIDAKLTGYISWSAVSAWYANLPIADTGLLLAEWPWSGYYDVGTSIWVNAHTSQFTEPGWTYIDSASGYLDSGASYVSLTPPAKSEFSTVIETMDAETATTVSLRPAGGLADKPVHLWSTNVDSATHADDFVHRSTLRAGGGGLSITLEPGHVYTLSTTTGQGKGSASSDANLRERMTLPYTETFEALEPGELAPYFSDLDGAFEVVTCGGDRTGQCYRQQTDRQPIVWSEAGYMDPTTVLGDPRWWGNYRISTEFLLEEPGYVELLGRISTQPGFQPTVDGYHLRVHSDGRWELYSMDHHAGRASLDSSSGTSAPERRAVRGCRSRSGPLRPGEVLTPAQRCRLADRHYLDMPAHPRVKEAQADPRVLAGGEAEIGTGSWHRMSLRMRGSTIGVRIDGERVAEIEDQRQLTGNVGLRVSGWDHAQFDNVTVAPHGPKPEFIPQQEMTVSATSAQDFYAGYTYEAANAIDGRPETIWHTEFGPDKPPLPESITLDLGGVRSIAALAVQPRYDRVANGMITRYRVYTSNDGVNFERVASGTWPVSSSTKIAALPGQVHARYIRLQAVDAVNGNAAAGEINVITG